MYFVISHKIYGEIALTQLIKIGQLFGGVNYPKCAARSDSSHCPTWSLIRKVCDHHWFKLLLPASLTIALTFSLIKCLFIGSFQKTNTAKGSKQIDIL